jgi:hypothetical protein
MGKRLLTKPSKAREKGENRNLGRSIAGEFCWTSSASFGYALREIALNLLRVDKIEQHFQDG